MYEKLKFFALRIVREIGVAKNDLEKFYKGEEQRKDLFHEMHEVFIRAENFKEIFHKGGLKIKHINQVVRDARRLNRYVRSTITPESFKDQMHHDEILKIMDKMDEKVKKLIATAEELNKTKTVVKKLSYA